MKQWAHKKSGFTIVELLIVVVVIAILAAITIVAFNGIQERANNASINDSASKAHRLIQAYIGKNGTYPYTADTAFICITTDTTCRRNGPLVPGSSVLDSEVATVGGLPKSVPMAASNRAGITYNYNPARTVNGDPAPVVLSYYLKGINTSCGLPALTTESTTAVSSTNGYTNGNIGGSGLTQCIVSIPGPSS